jgi:hypothetical protein
MLLAIASLESGFDRFRRNRMPGLSLTPCDLAARLVLALALALFLGLAFEEIYKSEHRSTPGGIGSFPMLATAGAMLMQIEQGRVAYRESTTAQGPEHATLEKHRRMSG